MYPRSGGKHECVIPKGTQEAAARVSDANLELL
jgi:hypothetical protein